MWIYKVNYATDILTIIRVSELKAVSIFAIYHKILHRDMYFITTYSQIFFFSKDSNGIKYAF